MIARMSFSWKSHQSKANKNHGTMRYKDGNEFPSKDVQFSFKDTSYDFSGSLFARDINWTELKNLQGPVKEDVRFSFKTSYEDYRRSGDLSCTSDANHRSNLNTLPNRFGAKGYVEPNNVPPKEPTFTKPVSKQVKKVVKEHGKGKPVPEHDAVNNLEEKASSSSDKTNVKNVHLGTSDSRKVGYLSL